MYIQGAIFTGPILISGLLPLSSYYLRIEAGKKINTENEQNMSSGPFSHDGAHFIFWSYCLK